MKVQLAAVTERKASKSDPCELLVRAFVERGSRYTPVESLTFPSEAALLASSLRQPGRPAATIVLCDSTGEQVTSLALAEYVRGLRDNATQRLLFGIGPADGWSKAALTQAGKIISFGRITLPHELARAVLAEQIYRALTILAGHPYHMGH